MKEVLKSASKTITQEAFCFQVDVLPKNKIHSFLQKKGWMESKRSFEIHPLTMGSCYRISNLIMSVDHKGEFTIPKVIETIGHHMDKMAEIVAIAIKNGKERPSQAMIDFLMYNLTTKEMMLLVKAVVSSLNVEDFLHTIILTKGINVMEKKKSEMSPQVPGSMSEEQ